MSSSSAVPSMGVLLDRSEPNLIRLAPRRDPRILSPVGVADGYRHEEDRYEHAFSASAAQDAGLLLRTRDAVAPVRRFRRAAAGGCGSIGKLPGHSDQAMRMQIAWLA